MAKLSICKSRHNSIEVVYGSKWCLISIFYFFFFFQKPCSKQHTLLGSSLGTDQESKLLSQIPASTMEKFRCAVNEAENIRNSKDNLIVEVHTTWPWLRYLNFLLPPPETEICFSIRDCWYASILTLHIFCAPMWACWALPDTVKCSWALYLVLLSRLKGQAAGVSDKWSLLIDSF